jgi:hypothetical protein
MAKMYSVWSIDVVTLILCPVNLPLFFEIGDIDSAGLVVFHRAMLPRIIIILLESYPMTWYMSTNRMTVFNLRFWTKTELSMSKMHDNVSSK